MKSLVHLLEVCCWVVWIHIIFIPISKDATPQIRTTSYIAHSHDLWRSRNVS